MSSRCNAEYARGNQSGLGYRARGIFKFSEIHREHPFQSQRLRLNQDHELCTRIAFAPAFDPVYRPYFYGPDRVADLDPCDHLFGWADASDVHRSGVDPDLPDPQPPRLAQRLAKAAPKP